MAEIQNLKSRGFASLAPLAGVADRAFRELCVGYGAAFVTSEMVSAKGLTMQDKKSKELITLHEAERPAGIQLFGTDPQIMAEATAMVLDVQPEFIDLNMGCPAPKIVGGGAGSALMKTPKLAGEIVSAVVSAAKNTPVTVKFRIGWDEDHINAVEFAKICEDAGASALTVHGRTRMQMYAPPVHTACIRDVKHAVSIPVIGNGDVTSEQTAALLYEQTGCDFVSVGRGALGRPWIFSQINAYLREGRVLPEPPVAERMRVMLSHVQKICAYKGEKIGIQESRKHAAWYVKGIRGAAKYRSEICTLQSVEQLAEIAFKIVAQQENNN